MTDDTSKWKGWLIAIEKTGLNLTAFEEKFIEDMRERFDRFPRVFLSTTQASLLENIYAERTP